MKNYQKHFIAFFLLSLFLTPSVLKIVDVFEHNHSHQSCNSAKEKHIHQLQDTCTILAFSLPSFIPITKQFTSDFRVENTSYYCNFYQQTPLQRVAISFGLRAPPFLISIS